MLLKKKITLCLFRFQKTPLLPTLAHDGRIVRLPRAFSQAFELYELSKPAITYPIFEIEGKEVQILVGGYARESSAIRDLTSKRMAERTVTLLKETVIQNLMILCFGEPDFLNQVRFKVRQDMPLVEIRSFQDEQLLSDGEFHLLSIDQDINTPQVRQWNLRTLSTEEKVFTFFSPS